MQGIQSLWWNEIVLLTLGGILGALIHSIREHRKRREREEWHRFNYEQMTERIRKMNDQAASIKTQCHSIRDELDKYVRPCDRCGKHWNAYRIVEGRSLCLDCAMLARRTNEAA